MTTIDIDQAYVDSITNVFPIVLSDDTTINITSDITTNKNLLIDGTGVSGTNSYKITLNGNAHTITINNFVDYTGLVKSKNVGTVVTGVKLATSGTTTLAANSGWIGYGCERVPDNPANSFQGTIDSCISTGNISNDYSGGIVGRYAGGGGKCIITNCYSTGNITGDITGGIAGGNSGVGGVADGSCQIINCYSTGNISGEESGGIVGHSAGASFFISGGNGDPDSVWSSGTCQITNCYSTGTISGEFSGGIAGSTAGNTGDCIITNCYSTGAISGISAGGIAGSEAGTGNGGGNCTITNCYSTGAISGIDNTAPIPADTAAGGIVGSSAGCTLINCYATGAITNHTDGIVGGDPRDQLVKINVLHEPKSTWVLDNASLTLDYAGGAWKMVNSRAPFKLMAFLSDVTINYDATTEVLTYTSRFPINPFSYLPTFTIGGDGDLTDEMTLSSDGKSLTLANASGFNTDGLYYITAGSVTINTFYIQNTNKITESMDISRGDLYNYKYTYPITISGATYVKITGGSKANTGITGLLQSNMRFIISNDSGNHVTIGSPASNLAITINNSPGYTGLVQSSSVKTIVNGFGVIPTGTTTLGTKYGWIGSEKFQGTINSCYSTGDISGGEGGGIAGKNVGYQGTCTISNCYSTGFISGANCGGILGVGAANQGTCTINNCYSTGDISGLLSGGIAGGNAGISGTCIISNCYSTGNIINRYCGGIVGVACGAGSGISNCTITNCYSTGTISAPYSGGIAGPSAGAGAGANCTITNCYSLGTISGGSGLTAAGGIVGADAGILGKCTINNCYTIGTVSNGTDGIVGGNKGNVITDNNLAEKSGIWSDTNAIKTLDSTSKYWKILNNNNHWLLISFLTDVTIEYDDTNPANPILKYTTSFMPISVYQGFSPIFRITNGTNTARMTLDYTGHVLTLSGADAVNFNNANITVLDVYDVDIKVSQLNSFIVSQTSKITEDTVISRSDVYNYMYSYPITISATANVSFDSDMIVGGMCFEVTNDSVEIGVKDTLRRITINNAGLYSGFVKTYTGDGLSETLRDSFVTVQYLGILSSGTSELQKHTGWIGKSTDYHIGFYGTIDNCYTEGHLYNDACGGIAGTVGGGNELCTISNCYSTGKLIANTCGGLVGNISVESNLDIIDSYSTGDMIGAISCGIIYIGSDSNVYRNVNIRNTYSIGKILGSDSGGIINMNNDYLYITIDRCYSTGDISGQYSGGIAGSGFGVITGTCSINNCYSTGAISGQSSGGIAGSNVSPKSHCQINNCYSTGAISGAGAGGIVGDNAAGSVDYVDGTCTITGCYSSGAITGKAAGGIAGISGGVEGDLIITGCYSIGTISGDGVGGIVSTCGDRCVINSCYSVGAISGPNSGGISGYLSKCSIINCYTSGAISGIDNTALVPANTAAGGISGSSSTSTITNCYTIGAITNSTDGIVGGDSKTANVTDTRHDTKWSDSNTLDSTSKSWKIFGNEYPWALETFLTNITITYNATTKGLTYTSDIFPINPYTGFTPTFTIKNGATSSNMTLNAKGLELTLVDGSAFNNSNITTLALYNGTTLVRYLNSFIVAGISTISTDTLLTREDVYNYKYSYPITVTGSTSITFDSDMYVGNMKFVVGASDMVTIGNSGVSTKATSDTQLISIVGVGGYVGLVSSISIDTLVQNISVVSVGSNIAERGGWIGTSSFQGTISNCSSTGAINNLGSGGIVGDNAGAGTGGSCTITDCHSTGDISGINFTNEDGRGGIAGSYAGANSGNCTISNCYSTGAISCIFGGGITGSLAGPNGNCTITNCYSTGDISSDYSGGISGWLAGKNYGNCTITNCYSTGDISSGYSGGIAGTGAGTHSGNCQITNCYSTGAISGAGTGGIAGASAGVGDGYSTGNCTINNCYSTGSISGEGSGGIVGDNFGPGDGGGDSGSDIIDNCTISNCYSTGTISGGSSGGIAGTGAGYKSNCQITNCYSIGEIIGFKAGGIVGSDAGTNYGSCTITNCYVAAPVKNGTDGIYGANPINLKVVNTIYNKTWSDNIASSVLNNPSDVWAVIYPNWPWKLAVFIKDASYTYLDNTFTYTNIFPVNDTSAAISVTLVNSGVKIGTRQSINLLDKTVTFTNIPGLDNDNVTYVTLYNDYDVVGYVDSFTVVPTTTTTTESPTTSTSSTSSTSTSTTSTTSSTTIHPGKLVTVSFSINANYNQVITSQSNGLETYKSALLDEIVNVTDAPRSSINILSVTPGSIVNLLQIPVDYVYLLQYSVQVGTFAVTINGMVYYAISSSFVIIDNICFQKGTLILTPSGYKIIEKLQVGDLVKTAQGRVVPIKRIASFIGKEDKCPLYVIKRNTYGDNLPLADLYMSGGHAFRVGKKWCHTSCSSKSKRISVDDIEYYNIVLENYLDHTLVANGMEVESLFDMKDVVMTWKCEKDNCTPTIEAKKSATK